ncbi:sulfotransferase 2B1-like [Lampetra fluviatilis]
MSTDLPDSGMFEVGGMQFVAPLCTPESVRRVRSLHVRDDDVFIATYAKSGTTWMQEIASLLLSDGDLKVAATSCTWQRAPYLEGAFRQQQLELQPSPRLMTTHLQLHLAPQQLTEGGKGKIIYLARHPKDTLVSLYEFSKISCHIPDPGDFKTYVEIYLEDQAKVNAETWFKHVREWYEMRHKANILFMTFEEMIKDLRGSVLRVSRFLDRPQDDSTIDSIVHHCSFASMRVNKMTNYEAMPAGLVDLSKGPFMRKGTVGDWKNYFTVEQSERFDELYAEKMRGCGLTFPDDLSQL